MDASSARVGGFMKANLQKVAKPGVDRHRCNNEPVSADSGGVADDDAEPLGLSRGTSFDKGIV
jgi:hypothetical protein